MSTAAGLAAVLVLILLNGWFVAAEFAFVTVRRTRLEEQAQAEDPRARRALRVAEQLSFMLSGAQLGITVSSLALGFVAAPVFAQALEPLLTGLGAGSTVATSVAVAAGFTVSTAAQMVLGELAPKNFALARPEPLALGLARSQLLFLRLAGPLIRVFDRASNAFLRLLRVEPVEHLESGVSSEELGHIISASGAEGTLPPAMAGLLQRSLEFRELRAADALVPRPQVRTIDAGATCAQLRALAVETGHSRFPVIGEDRDDVRGIVQAKDVLGVPPGQRATTGIDRLVQDVLAVPESSSLRDLLVRLRDSHTQMAVIVDEYGGTAGIVTLEDIVEELVGDIEDEYDESGRAVLAQPDGSYRVPGTWRIDETERDTGIALPPGDYDTVGGLVMAALGRVPDVGDEVAVDGARLRVLDLDGLAVGHVAVAAEAVAGEEPAP